MLPELKGPAPFWVGPVTSDFAMHHCSLRCSTVGWQLFHRILKHLYPMSLTMVCPRGKTRVANVRPAV